ncbi:MAG: tetratricopeptide repeat protein, partial [Proteobacteria bacterium]|nr:tetratricopeptide repeat protein [Pseudomonadota bacterium]
MADNDAMTPSVAEAGAGEGPATAEPVTSPPVALLEAARSHAAAGRFPDAEATLDALLEQHPRDVPALIEKAR